MSDPISNGEDAFKSLVDALALTGLRGIESVSVEVYTGQDDEQRQVPRVTCVIDRGGREVVLGTGNFEQRGYIDIITHPKDESRTIHNARVEAVVDALHIDTLEADLSAAVDDYHCFQVRWMAPEPQQDGAFLITRLPFEIVHCCSDLT